MSRRSPSPGPGPAGLRRGRLLWAAVVLVVLGLGGFTLLGWHAERSIERLPVDALGQQEAEAAETSDEKPAEPAASVGLNILVVGSDNREDLTAAEVRELRLGRFPGQQADAILLVQIRPGDERAAVVSIPRDLRVETPDGDLVKMADTLDRGGPDLVVRAVESTTGVRLDHYVEVSISGFLSAVEAVGSVEICLDEPLRDWRAGADFAVGCHEMGPAESLAFVRSRAGARADFRRIDRQQKFIRATLERMTAARTLANPVRLVRLVDGVAANVKTDEHLSLADMRRLAVEFRGVADGVGTITVPAYPLDVDGVPYLTLYEPGAAALFRSLRNGETPPPRGEPEQRGEVTVGLWTAGLIDSAARIESTLYFAGFHPRVLGLGPLEARRTTTVFASTAALQRAEWVAATLGAEIAERPPDAGLPAGVDVLVLVGRDAGETPAGQPTRCRGGEGRASQRPSASGSPVGSPRCPPLRSEMPL